MESLEACHTRVEREPLPEKDFREFETTLSIDVLLLLLEMRSRHVDVLFLDSFLLLCTILLRDKVKAQ